MNLNILSKNGPVSRNKSRRDGLFSDIEYCVNSVTRTSGKYEKPISMRIPRMLMIMAIIVSVSRADDKAALALRFVGMSGGADAIKQSWDDGIKPSLDQMRAQGAPVELVDSIRIETQRFFAENFSWDATKPQIVKLFTDAFTEEELHELVAFYETPTGQKAFARLPILTQQSAALAMIGVRAKMPDLQKRIGTIIQNYKIKADDIAATVPATLQAPKQYPK